MMRSCPSHYEYVDDCFDCQERKRKTRESCHNWYIAHKEGRREYNRQWRKANPDKVKEYDRQQRRDHPERVAIKVKTWKWAHNDEVTKQVKRWRTTHKEEINKTVRQKRRLKKLVPQLYETGVLNDMDLITIQRQRQSHYPISKTVEFINGRAEVAQQSWEADEITKKRCTKPTLRRVISHLHEAGVLDDTDLQTIRHQHKSHLRPWETISYVRDRLATQQSWTGPTSQPLETISDNACALDHVDHFVALENEIIGEWPVQRDYAFEEYGDEVPEGLMTNSTLKPT